MPSVAEPDDRRSARFAFSLAFVVRAVLSRTHPVRLSFEISDHRNRSRTSARSSEEEALEEARVRHRLVLSIRFLSVVDGDVGNSFFFLRSARFVSLSLSLSRPFLLLLSLIDMKGYLSVISRRREGSLKKRAREKREREREKSVLLFYFFLNPIISPLLNKKLSCSLQPHTNAAAKPPPPASDEVIMIDGEVRLKEKREIKERKKRSNKVDVVGDGEVLGQGAPFFCPLTLDLDPSKKKKKKKKKHS